MSNRRRTQADRYVAGEDDITIHMPAGARPIPGIKRQTTGPEDPITRARRGHRGVGLGELRDRRGFTQTQLAEQLGMRQGRISTIEGSEDPKLSTVTRFAHWLDEEARVELVVRYGDGRVDAITVAEAATEKP